MVTLLEFFVPELSAHLVRIYLRQLPVFLDTSPFEESAQTCSDHFPVQYGIRAVDCPVSRRLQHRYLHFVCRHFE